MSWDVILLTQNPVGAPPEGPPPLGEAADVRKKISRSMGRVDWSNPAWGVLDGAGWSAEFNHQSDGPTKALMLHVRGEGDPVPAILKLCADTGWIAFDATEGEVITGAARASASWEKFRHYSRKNENA